MTQLEPLELNIKEVSTDMISIRIRIAYNTTSGEIRLNKKDFFNWQKQLTDCLFDFVNSNYDKAKLKALAEEGYVAFRNIETHFDSDRDFKDQWQKQFLGHYSNKKRIKVIEEVHDKKKLHIRFPKGYSFPFGLLFTTDPKQINWKKTTVSKIIIHFFDLKFKIWNGFDESTSPGSVVLPDMFLKDNPSQIKVIHAINNTLETKTEESSWELDSNIVPFKVYQTSDLLHNWHIENYPRIIHFSSHYNFDGTKAPPYALTLSNGDVFNIRDLVTYRKSPPNKKAFFFLNACDSGTIQDAGYTDVLTDLFPKYSLGFIATAYSILDKSAGGMPKKFYEIFIQEGKNIFDSFIESKHYLILSRQQYSALGYLIWQVNPNLLYANPNFKRKPLNKFYAKKLLKK